MVTNFCFSLALLLIPLFVDLLNVQAVLTLSRFGHAVAEVLISCCISWLIIQILRLDYWPYLQSLIRQKKYSYNE